MTLLGLLGDILPSSHLLNVALTLHLQAAGRIGRGSAGRSRKRGAHKTIDFLLVDLAAIESIP